MNTNHAKAIKGMSIANIVLAALGIFGMLIAWAGLGVGGAAISGSGYDYFYTDDGLYFTTDDVSVLLGMLGFLVFLVIVCAVLILIAGILGVRGAAKPDKLRGIMIWNIVAAVVSLLSCCWVSLVLCIIVAVFANKDRALYAAAPAPAAPYGYAPAAAPVAPVAPQQPVQPCRNSSSSSTLSWKYVARISSGTEYSSQKMCSAPGASCMMKGSPPRQKRSRSARRSTGNPPSAWAMERSARARSKDTVMPR